MTSTTSPMDLDDDDGATAAAAVRGPAIDPRQLDARNYLVGGTPEQLRRLQEQLTPKVAAAAGVVAPGPTAAERKAAGGWREGNMEWFGAGFDGGGLFLPGRAIPLVDTTFAETLMADILRRESQAKHEYVRGVPLREDSNRGQCIVAAAQPFLLRPIISLVIGYSSERNVFFWIKEGKEIKWQGDHSSGEYITKTDGLLLPLSWWVYANTGWRVSVESVSGGRDDEMPRLAGFEGDRVAGYNGPGQFGLQHCPATLEQLIQGLRSSVGDEKKAGDVRAELVRRIDQDEAVRVLEDGRAIVIAKWHEHCWEPFGLGCECKTHWSPKQRLYGKECKLDEPAALFFTEAAQGPDVLVVYEHQLPDLIDELQVVAGAVASVALKPTRICTECAAPLPRRRNFCAYCKEAFYCSRACQVADWNSRHDKDCSKVRKNQVWKQVTAVAKAAARVTGMD